MEVELLEFSRLLRSEVPMIATEFLSLGTIAVCDRTSEGIALCEGIELPFSLNDASQILKIKLIKTDHLTDYYSSLACIKFSSNRTNNN
jgi:hypothetical protein